MHSIIGYDLNEKNCQISFYNEEQQEPQTMEVAADHYQIPLVLGKYKDTWYIGNEAKRLEGVQGGYVIDDLYEKTLQQRKISIGETSYEAIRLLGKFVEISLERFETIGELVFTVPSMDIDVVRILKSIGQYAGVKKQHIYIQDYKESFCHYMFHQPKELWQYEAALFYYEQDEVKAYMLKRLQTGYGRSRDMFVTVDEVAKQKIEELTEVYPVLNVDRAKDADLQFKEFVEHVFNKKLVSSVFLVGEGFENNWYPQSLRVLCNGRRAFMGNNLYSKGACYTAYCRHSGKEEGPIYLDERKMTDQICLKMRIQGKDSWYPLVSWGTRWYEADMQCEVLLENLEDIEIHVESLMESKMQVATVSVSDLPKREAYTYRLQICVIFQDETTCRVSFKDVGFGEFFPATGFYKECTIQLGGSHGKFNSLS